MPWRHFLGWPRERLSPRKYVDLVWRTDGRIGSWDPPKKIQPGDYGTVWRETGEFLKEGNIFDDEFKKRYPDMVFAPPVNHDPDQERLLFSRGVTVVDIGRNGDQADTALGSATTYKFAFSSKRGFVLLMIKPAISQLIHHDQLRRLAGLGSDMQGKVLVTEVYSCPAYALTLSDGVESETTITFQFSLLAHQPLSVNVGRNGNWVESGNAGQWRCGGGNPSESHTYYPLFALRSLSDRETPHAPRFRTPDTTSLNKIATLNLFVPPWEQIDESGEEIEPDEDIDV